MSAGDTDQVNPHAAAWRGRFATSAREYYARTARDRVRHAALSALALRDRLSGSTAKALAVRRVQVILLHHLFEHERPAFRAQLNGLSRDHEFISYGEAVKRIRTGVFRRPAIAFTCDDGRASSRAMAEDLERMGARACFFVCPGIVGETRMDRLSDFCINRLHYPPTPFLTWEDLTRLRDRGHEIGSHTTNHVNLGKVSETEASEEIGRSRDVILSRLGECDHFAWPYGLQANITAEALRIAGQSGYRSIASAVRGCHREGGASPPVVQDAGWIRRDNTVAEWPVSHLRWLLARNVRGGAAEE